MAAVAVIRAAELHSASLTSPALFENRERVRVDGVPISQREYEEVGAKIEDALRRMADPAPHEYLSPNGAYLAAALLMGERYQVDAYVIEAGMGGGQDELSILEPDVVVVTSVFGEHLGRLGETVEAVAHEKARVVRSSHQKLVMGPLAASHESIFRSHAHSVGARVIEAESLPLLDASLFEDVVPYWENLVVGGQSAMVMARDEFGRSIEPAAASQAIRFMRYLGRGSQHLDVRGRQWVLDAAISGAAVERSLRWADARLPRPYAVLVCIPDGKDVVGVREALSGREHVFWCDVDEPTLTTTSAAQASGMSALPRFSTLAPALDFERFLAVGTWSFISHIATSVGLQRSQNAPQ